MNGSTIASPILKLAPCEVAPQGVLCGQGRLRGRVWETHQLSRGDKDRMYALLAEYFTNVTRARFEQDLAEKEWVVVLTDPVRDQIQGFSTLMKLQTVFDGQPVVAFFSGDTIVDKNFWGETELPRLWSRHVFGLCSRIRDARVYWLLICSGYKTYRFLSVFYREFYPTYRYATSPSMKRLLDVLALQKFQSEYDPQRGVVRFAHATPLRSGVAEITNQRLRDPHVDFFVAANPGYPEGDELACLTELTLSNLTPAGRRMVGLPSRSRV